MRYRVAYVVDGRTQYTGSFSTKRAADAAKARLHLTYAFVRVEQDRRVIKAQLSQYAQRQVIEHDTAAMAALLAGEGVEQVTVWTDSHGRSHHRSVQS